MTGGQHKEEYEKFEDGEAGASASAAPQPLPPDSLDPGAHIEMSAAVSGVVPDDTFTVDQAVNSLGFGKFQVKLSLITGLCWMADSMEMMILAILGPALHCDWHLSQWQQAFLTTAVFIGMMLSSAFWGYLADKYGRKRSLKLASIMLAYWGLLSAFAPTYSWIVLLRGLVGFGIGCVPQSVTLYAEFLPTRQRGKCVILLDCFWAMGACAEVILALWVMPQLGWNGLLAFSIVPLVLFIFVCKWLPESARFNALSGYSDKALATLQKIAEENGKPKLLGRLIVDEVPQTNRGRIRDLLVQDLRCTTLLLWFIWTSCAFCYYGVVLMTTELFEAPQGSICSLSEANEASTCTASCRPLSTKDYVDLLWTTLAEFPGMIFTLVLIEFLGRKTTMALEFAVFVASIIFLFICTSSRAWLTVILFVARGIISGVFQAVYVYTPEVYPTSLRAVGIGTCSGMARFGAMLTPVVAQVLLNTSIHLATATYGTVAVLSIVAALMLPIETRGRAMT